MAEKKDDNRAKDQAKGQLDSIVAMVKRLKHAQECTGKCKLSSKQILEGLGFFYKKGDKASGEDRKQYHDEDDARQTIQGDILSIQVRSDWHVPGEDDKPSEFEILLCTGGPAVRIVGELDENLYPDRARLEYQDWFTPWTEYLDASSDEREALLTYALEFYFGA